MTTGPYGRLISATMPCPGVTPRDLLRAAVGRERFYWEDGRGDTAYAGEGIAAELVAWGEDRFGSIARSAAALFAGALIAGDAPGAGPRLFGGFAFQDDFVPDNTWTVYAPGYFILPHYQLTRAGGQSWLTINAHLSPDDDPDAALEALWAALEYRCDLLRDSTPPAAPPRPELVAVDYPMPYAMWARIIDEATTRMRAGELAKAVLARVCEIRFDGPVPVDAALDHLAAHYADCYRFLFEPRPGHTFYGATPELLAHVEGQRVETMALAGSIRRGADAGEDETYAARLLADPKERYEHALVVEGLRERLTPLTDSLDIPAEPGVLRLSTIQHLHTPARGHLRDALGALPVVERLHPTPALGGSPQAVALDLIRRSEPVPRGWYAAPIGWLGPNLDGEFGVAIRSAVGQDRRVWLYAGAGIVADSVAEREWDETALKFRPMLDALGIRERVTIG